MLRRLLTTRVLLFFSNLLESGDGRSRSPSVSAQEILTLRALVSTKDAGVIIGKGGKNVADLREQTGVKAGVSKVVPGVHERVLTVSGDVESVARVRIYFRHNCFMNCCADMPCDPYSTSALLHPRRHTVSSSRS